MLQPGMILAAPSQRTACSRDITPPPRPYTPKHNHHISSSNSPLATCLPLSAQRTDRTAATPPAPLHTLRTTTPFVALWHPPACLSANAQMAVSYGYDEVNLNCGCPSDRVAGAGCFGASLMLNPQLVADCMRAMGEAAGGVEVNVKCRWALGVNNLREGSSCEKCTCVDYVSP